MSEEPLLKVTELSKSFGGVQALSKVSFKLLPGELLGVIGPNGSGKTTLVNLITGFVKSSSGAVFYRSRDITNWAPYRIIRLGIARTFQMVRPFYQLPAFKNMIIPLYSPRVKKLAGGKYGDRDAVALDLLEEDRPDKVRKVSHLRRFRGTRMVTETSMRMMPLSLLLIGTRQELLG